MASQPSSCRICGLHITGEALLTHELTCLQTSQENGNMVSRGGNNSDKADAKRRIWLKNLPEQDKSRPADDEQDDINVSSNMASTSVTASRPRFSPRRQTVATSQPSPKNQTETRVNDCLCSQRRKTVGSIPSMRYDRKKPDNLFPTTKKYRYYPIPCEYCHKRFQPNKLKVHQQKHHLDKLESKGFIRSLSTATLRVTSKEPAADRSKSVGGIPRSLKVCYICGQLYGSKSIKIHEPKCLDKWRIQNDQLPPELRAPEPVKPEPILQDAEADKGYSLPNFNPAADAAFQSHLATLIPCTYCSRTFSPDRIQKHMSCCIERPRTRECATPIGGKITR